MLNIEEFVSTFGLLVDELLPNPDQLSRETIELSFGSQKRELLQKGLQRLAVLEAILESGESLVDTTERAHMLLGAWLVSQAIGIPRIYWRDELFGLLNRVGMLPGDPFYSALGGEVFRFEARQLQKSQRQDLGGAYGAAYCPTCLIPGDLPVNSRTSGGIDPEFAKKLTTLSTFYLRFHSVDYVRSGGQIVYFVDTGALTAALQMATPGARSYSVGLDKFREFKDLNDGQEFRLVKSGVMTDSGLMSMILGSRGGVIADIANRVTAPMSYCRWMDDEVLVRERKKFDEFAVRLRRNGFLSLHLSMQTSVAEFDSWLRDDAKRQGTVITESEADQAANSV